MEAACDLLLQELADRFDQSEFLPEVLGLESLLLKAANGDHYESELATPFRQPCIVAALSYTCPQHRGRGKSHLISKSFITSVIVFALVFGSVKSPT